MIVGRAVPFALPDLQPTPRLPHAAQPCIVLQGGPARTGWSRRCRPSGRSVDTAREAVRIALLRMAAGELDPGLPMHPGRLVGLGHPIAASTVWTIVKKAALIRLRDAPAQPGASS